jgi:hypothetical protein
MNDVHLLEAIAGLEDWLVVPGLVSLRDGIETLCPLGEAERVAFARDEASH